MLLLTLPGYALITIEKKPGTGTLSGHLDDINANDLELDGKIDGKVSDDAFTSDWSSVTDVAPSQAALYNYLINFDADGDGLFSDEAWFPAIFDPAVPGEIGGTTPAAGTFTDLIAGTLALTPVDGQNRLTFPENTARSPASGAEEIYNEGGLMKYSENGVEKNFVTIDDTAGDGDTTVTLSADKIVELIVGGSGVVPDGTSTNDILSWDGDSWEPIALTDHPAFSSLLTAFNNAGLNSFIFTPSVTYPIWAATSPVSVSFDVTDTSTTYAVADVDYQYDGAGGFVENMTNTTGDTWTASVAIATDGAHTIQLEAVDDKSPTPNSGQSAIYTINFDGTDPVIGTVTPSALTHDGLGATFTATVGSVTEPNVLNCQWSLYDVTDAAIETNWTVFTGLSITGISIPADQHTYRLDVRCTDLAGNIGTASSANIEYSAPISALMYWSADSATVLDTPSARGITAAGGAGVGTYAGRQAANADGYDRYFTVSTPTDLLSTAHFDIEIDVYIPTGSTGGTVFRLEGLSGGEALQIGVTTTGINCYYATAANHAYTTTVSTDAWHTIRWRFDTATNSSVVSLDATDDTTTITENMTTSYTGMTLGGRSGYNGFDGYFDEVYSHAVD